MPTLFEKICDVNSLHSAWEKVREKNSQGGLDGVLPCDMEGDISKKLAKLSNDLRTQKYIPVPYAKSAMPKFNEANEWRKLSLPAVIDKIVQEAFVRVVDPIFSEDFLDCSYAYRKGKGPVKALKMVEHTLYSCDCKWVVSMDIDNFFDTIDHQIMLQEFGKKVKEQKVLKLLSLWLKTGIISKKGDWLEADEGIAQGSVVSPLCSNIYLHPLDKLAAELKVNYIRYSDNLILLSPEKGRLYGVYEDLNSFLEKQLKLKLNDNPYPFKGVKRGFTFLGIYFRGENRRISTGKEKKIFRKLNWLTDKMYQADPDTFLKRLKESIEGKKRYYSFVNPIEQFKAFDEHLLKRLRYLCATFHKKGFFKERKDIETFLERVVFFSERTDSEKSKMCGLLAGEVWKYTSEKGEPEKKPEKKQKRLDKKESAQAKRVTAQKNRYLRKVAGQTELTVSTPGVFIGKTSGRVTLKMLRQNVFESPLSKIKHIAIGSKGVTISSDIVFECAKNKIPITFYNFKGQPEAVLKGPMHSMGDISVLQIRAYQTETALALAKKILSGKSRNQINLLKFYLRHRKNTDSEFTEVTMRYLEKMEGIALELDKIDISSGFTIARDRVLGVEGRLSAFYWSCTRKLTPPELGFTKREHRHAPDLVNNMINYGYGILYQKVWIVVEKFGLNPHISFLHAFQANKPTLVYDLIEEYRQPFVDRAIFSLLNKGKKGSDLKLDKNNLLVKDTREQVAKAVLKRLSGLISFRGEKVQGEEIINIQTGNVVDFLRGRKNYRPFIAGY